MRKSLQSFKLAGMDRYIWIDTYQINTVSEDRNSTTITLIGDPDPYRLEDSAIEVLRKIREG